MSDPVRIVVGSGESAVIRVASSGVGAEVRVPESGLIVGPAGEDGATFFPEVSEEGIISWTNDGGYNNPEPVNIKGPAGNDGSDGEDGADGVSPAVSFATITGGHTMTVTDKDHPSGQSINIMDGEDGSTGADGTTFTPAVDASGNLSWTNDGGKQNPQTVNIKGPQGDAGQGVPAGGTTGQFLKKSSGTSYDTEWGTVEVPTKVSDLTNDTGFITGMEILSYGNSTWSDFLAAYTAKKVVYCRASSNSNPASGSQTRLAFMAYVTNATNPTFVEFQYYRSVPSHSDSQQGDQVFIYKLDKTAGWSVTTRNTFTAVDAGTGLSKTYSNGTLTLSVDGYRTAADQDEIDAAQDAEISDLESAVKSTVSLDFAPVAFSVDGTGYIKYADGTVASSSLSSHTDYIDVSYYKNLQYKRQGSTISNPASGMAFYDASFVYITGESAAPSQQQGEYLTELRTIVVPPTAKYARFALYTDVSTYGEFELYGETKIANDVNSLNDAVFTDVAVDFESAEVVNRIIAASTGKWASGGSSYIIPIESAQSLSVIGNARNGSIVGILKTANAISNTYPDYATGCSRTFVPKGQSETFEIPSDAKYVAVMKNAGNNIYTPESVEIRYENYVTKSELAELEEAWQGITHEKPNSIGELNVVRRCRQMTDIKWTPAFDIPRISQLDGGSGVYFEDVFKAGVEYTGIPYGQANRNASQWGKNATIGFKLGWEIGFDTFISAIGNAESIVAKESLYEATGGVHRASFYATICTALTGYALALPQYYTTTEQGNAPGMTDLGAVSSINLEDIHLGDMLWTSTHGAIITDKLRNSDGEIIGIEISEATTIGNADWNVQGSQYGGICRRRMWSLEDFVKWDSYHLYRYADVDNTPYEKSPYVDTGNEGDFARTMNFPVLPYMGENFEYVQGYIPSTKILTPAYRANETNKLRVTKDGNPWNENGTTDYYDVSGAYVSVEFSDVGTYEAYLCKLSNGEEVIKTKACHWTVVEPSA